MNAENGQSFGNSNAPLIVATQNCAPIFLFTRPFCNSTGLQRNVDKVLVILFIVKIFVKNMHFRRCSVVDADERAVQLKVVSLQWDKSLLNFFRVIGFDSQVP